VSLGAADFAAERKVAVHGERQRPAVVGNAPKEPALQDAISFSTDVYPAEHRFEMWREYVARNIHRVEAATPDKTAFGARARARQLPAGALVHHVALAPCSLIRTKELLSDGKDAMYFIICLGGTGHWHFGRQSIALESGQAALVPSSLLGGFRCDRSYRHLAVGLEREVVREFAPSPEALLLRPIDPGNEAAVVLTAYCRHLLWRPGAPTPGLGLLASRQLRELVAYALAPASELVRAAPFEGVMAARLRAMRDDIAAHFRDDTLSVVAVAARQRVTPRYVQMLFEREGTTFSQYVLGQRLACAHRMLSDLRRAGTTIAAIAFEAGFSDLSHFNRNFRRVYGATPSDVREAARTQVPPNGGEGTYRLRAAGEELSRGLDHI
jgi:AraC-like DNA-binding protein